MTKHLVSRLIALSLTVVVFAPAAQADARLTWPIEGPPLDCSRPSVASPQPLISVTVGEQDGSGVWTSFEGIACTGFSGGGRSYRQAHGPGTRPEVGVLLDETYVLAFVRGDSLVVREGDGEANWATAAVAYLGAQVDGVGRIDLWCSPYHAYDEWAWLAVWSGSYSGGAIRFMRRTGSGWDALETVPNADSELYDYAFPQVTEYGGPASPLPRIYYNDMDPEPCLKYVDWQPGGGWTDPVSHASGYAFGSEFDAARTPDGYVFLSTGLQPT
ncbi:hypothetical protein KKG45_01175, partial [bacterium]|nr:hypothetical protein [bacterium]